MLLIGPGVADWFKNGGAICFHDCEKCRSHPLIPLNFEEGLWHILKYK